MFGRLAVRESEVTELRAVVREYSDKFKLRTRARKLLDAEPTRAEFEKEIAKKKNAQIEDKASLETDILTLQKWIKLYWKEINFPTTSSRVTKADIAAFLKGKISDTEQEELQHAKKETYVQKMSPFLIQHITTMTAGEGAQGSPNDQPTSAPETVWAPTMRIWDIPQLSRFSSTAPVHLLEPATVILENIPDDQSRPYPLLTNYSTTTLNFKPQTVSSHIFSKDLERFTQQSRASVFMPRVRHTFQPLALEDIVLVY